MSAPLLREERGAILYELLPKGNYCIISRLLNCSHFNLSLEGFPEVYVALQIDYSYQAEVFDACWTGIGDELRRLSIDALRG